MDTSIPSKFNLNARQLLILDELLAHFEHGVWSIIHRDTEDFLSELGLTIDETIDSDDYIAVTAYSGQERAIDAEFVALVKRVVVEGAILCRDAAIEVLTAAESI